MKKWVKIVLIIIIFAGLLSGYLVWGNSSLGVTEYTVSPANLPESFDGFRIVQVSDLHNSDPDGRLIKKVADAKPDIIVITGDIVDAKKTDIAFAAEYAKLIAEIAPTYYITGNHEYRTGQYETLRPLLVEAGVIVLESETVKINRNGEEISITGIHDAMFYGSGEDNSNLVEFNAELKKLREGADSDTNILLCHIPQTFEVFAECGYDLVFTGHAHGGQFRFPIFGGGFFAPGQGWWPEYSEGMHVSGNTHMIISRGIGNSSFPLRLFNRPELVVCELSGDTK